METKTNHQSEQPKPETGGGLQTVTSNNSSTENQLSNAETQAMETAAAILQLKSSNSTPKAATPPTTKTTIVREWEDWFADLEAYQKQHGTCNVPPVNECSGDSIENDDDSQRQRQRQRQLCRWVIAQRESSREGSLLPQREISLNAINFDWSISHDDDLWTRSFLDLSDFKSKHGHCHVPLNASSDDDEDDSPNNKLARWIVRQRGDYHAGSLQPDQCQKLEEIGFAWTATLSEVQPCAAAVIPDGPSAKQEDQARTRVSDTTPVSSADTPTRRVSDTVSASSGEDNFAVVHELLQQQVLQQYQLDQRRKEMNQKQQQQQQPGTGDPQHQQGHQKSNVVHDEDGEARRGKGNVNHGVRPTMTASAWHEQDDDILRDLFEAQYHVRRTYARIEKLKSKLAIRVQRRSMNDPRHRHKEERQHDSSGSSSSSSSSKHLFLRQQLIKIKNQNKLLQQQLQQQTHQQNKRKHQQMVDNA